MRSDKKHFVVHLDERRSVEVPLFDIAVVFVASRCKSQIHMRLAPKADGWPGVVVTRNCRNLILTLPSLCYSKRNPEDVDAEQETHLYDALRYGLSRKRYSYGCVPLVSL